MEKNKNKYLIEVITPKNKKSLGYVSKFVDFKNKISTTNIREYTDSENNALKFNKSELKVIRFNLHSNGFNTKIAKVNNEV